MPGVDVGGLLRSGVAAACVAAGVLHLSAAADHRGMGGHVAFFVLVAAAQSSLGAAVLWARRPGRWLAGAAAVNLAVAIVWALSRTTGLPVDGGSTPEAMGFKDAISTLFEFGAVAGAGMWWLLPEPARQLPLVSRRLASALLGTGVWALGASGLLAGHTHSAGHTHNGGHDHGTAEAQVTSAHADGAGHSHALQDPGVEPVHAIDPAHQADHTHLVEMAAAEPSGRSGDGHSHAGSADLAAPDHGSHHAPPGHAAAFTAPGAGPNVHDHHHEPGEAAPAPTEGPDHEEGHGHDHTSDASDHQRQNDDDDHSGNAGEDRPGSPLDDVLKLLQPR